MPTTRAWFCRLRDRGSGRTRLPPAVASPRVPNSPSSPAVPVSYFSRFFLRNTREPIPNWAYVGALSPGEESHSLMHEPVSACRAFLSVASRIAPGGSSFASSRNRFASSARRSSKDLSCFKRRRCCCIAHSRFVVGGSAFGLSVTECHEPGGDGFILRFPGGKNGALVHIRRKNPHGPMGTTN
jgi:hypothetical protein